jgi:hypothetical protein
MSKTRYMKKIGPRYSHVSDPVLQLALFVSDMKLLLISLPPREEKIMQTPLKNAHKETDIIYDIGSSL